MARRMKPSRNRHASKARKASRIFGILSGIGTAIAIGASIAKPFLAAKGIRGIDFVVGAKFKGR